MADWIETPHESSSVEFVDETLVSRARNGAVKMRRLQTGRKRIYHIVLKGLTAARRDAVIALYDLKRDTTLTLDWNLPVAEGSPSPADTVMFGPDPIRWSYNDGYWSAEVALYEQ